MVLPYDIIEEHDATVSGSCRLWERDEEYIAVAIYEVTAKLPGGNISSRH